MARFELIQGYKEIVEASPEKRSWDSHTVSPLTPDQYYKLAATEGATEELDRHEADLIMRREQPEAYLQLAPQDRPNEKQ